MVTFAQMRSGGARQGTFGKKSSGRRTAAVDIVRAPFIFYSSSGRRRSLCQKLKFNGARTIIEIGRAPLARRSTSRGRRPVAYRRPTDDRAIIIKSEMLTKQFSDKKSKCHRTGAHRRSVGTLAMKISRAVA